MKSKSPVVTDYPPDQENNNVNSHCYQDLYEKLYSMVEVAQHCEPGSIWIVIDNNVYDVTNFRDDHPGGPDVFLEHAGRDCTVAFHDTGHSYAALQILGRFKIGMLREEDRIET